MEIDVKIDGIQTDVVNNVLVIKSKSPLKVLSSAIFNGGLKEATGILNIQVPEGFGSNKNDAHWSPESFVEDHIKRLKLPKSEVVGLMTAAKMKNVAVCIKRCGETTLTVLATAGRTVAVTAGEPTASGNSNLKRIGTINLILLVDGDLTEGCMVDAVKTMTEAKTVALRELDLRSQLSADLATGTLTDSVTVACTKRGEVFQFAGTFTLIGELIGKCVRKAVKEAMYKQEKLESNRPIIERLAERGITKEKIISLIAQEFSQADEERVRQIWEQVEALLSDCRIASLVVVSLRLDEDLGKDLFPISTVNRINLAEFQGLVGSLLVDPKGSNRADEFTARVLKGILNIANMRVDT